MRFLLVAFLTLACSVSTLRADLVISEVYSAGSSNTTYGVDWFELTNRSSASIDITGWVMDDSSASFGSAVPFGPELTMIGAGQSVVFLETSSANFANRVALFNQAWFGSNTSSVAFGSYNGSGVGLSSSADAVNIYNGLASCKRAFRSAQQLRDLHSTMQPD